MARRLKDERSTAGQKGLTVSDQSAVRTFFCGVTNVGWWEERGSEGID